MKSIAHSFISASLLATCAAPVASAASEVAPYTRLRDILVQKQDSSLVLSFVMDPADIKPGRDREVVFQPQAVNETDTLSFPSITVAGRNRYLTHMRNGELDSRSNTIYRAGKGENIVYSASVPWAPWMESAKVVMFESTQNCCKPVEPMTEQTLAWISNPIQTWTLPSNPRFIALTDESAVELEAQGRAFIDFVVNRTEIRDHYRGNAKELAKILSSIEKVKTDPDATITRLTIKGFASPEGSYDNNVRLAMGRTQALKEYVRQRLDFDAQIMFTDYEPEDWEGLRNWVVANDIADKDAILAIIDSEMAPDPKNSEIQKRFPKSYKLLLDSVYPALRHSDYTVRYKIRTFATLDELKKTYASHPERLRPADFYRIAESYPPGSPEFEEILLQASETYPSDSQAAINAANILLRRGEVEKAVWKLDVAGESGEAWFTRGLAAAAMSDFGRAHRLFTRAAEMGIPEAASEAERVNISRDNLKINYNKSLVARH